jgi:hypothetical protein
VTDEIVIPARFRGPSTSANGGYCCGVVARRIGGSAEVNLRLPPPLDRSLAFEQEGDGINLVDGDRIVADGRPCEADLPVPDPPSPSAARAAVQRYIGFRFHPFPQCFTCGPHRDHHDGLNVFPGQVEGTDIVASPWIPDPSLPADDGVVASEVVWAALDCPTGFGTQFFGEGRPAVLARLRGQVMQPVRIGVPHVAIGWPVSQEGRKREGGSALFNADGELVACASGLWIELKG